MFPRALCTLLLAGLAASALPAADLPAPMVARFIKILVSSTPDAKVACDDFEVNKELAKLGVPMDRDGRVAWTTKDVAAKAAKGRLVVTSQRDLLEQGAGIAIVNEDGKPAIYLNMANLVASKFAVPEAILKIGKR